MSDGIERCPACGLVVTAEWSEQLQSQLDALEEELVELREKQAEIMAQLALEWREVRGTDEPMTEDEYWTWRGKAKAAFAITAKKLVRLKAKVKKLRVQENQASHSTRFYKTLEAHGIDRTEMHEENHR